MPHFVQFSIRFCFSASDNSTQGEGARNLSFGSVTAPQAFVNSPYTVVTSSTSANTLLGRWRLSVELFGRVFLEDVGAEPCSVLSELGRFDVKETKFRREMERLRNSTQRDLTLEVCIKATMDSGK